MDEYKIKVTHQAKEHLVLIREYIATELKEPEIGENLYHCYPFFPIVREAKKGWKNMLEYHKKEYVLND